MYFIAYIFTKYIINTKPRSKCNITVSSLQSFVFWTKYLLFTNLFPQVYHWKKFFSHDERSDKQTSINVLPESFTDEMANKGALLSLFVMTSLVYCTMVNAGLNQTSECTMVRKNCVSLHKVEILRLRSAINVFARSGHPKKKICYLVSH